MHQGSISELTPAAAEQALREELARADLALAAAHPVLRHFLANEEPELLSDEVVARVRGMVEDVARQLAEARSADAGSSTIPALALEQSDLARRLADDADLLTFAHAQVLEGHMLERLRQIGGLDPVLPPLVVELAAQPDGAIAELAMQVLAAQARFVQHYHRMELPLGELPAELFHAAVSLVSETAAADGLRAHYREGDGRTALLARLALSLEEAVGLSIAHAGLSIFSSALARASERTREQTIVAVAARRTSRLALTLRAAGLAPGKIAEQLAVIHPSETLDVALDFVAPDTAASLLAASALEAAL